MKNDAFVSVVLVVKDQTEKLIPYLDKLSPYLGDNFSDYEIVIIDQKSSDDIGSRLKETLATHQSIRHIRLAKEVAADVALAAGIENAIGDFVINLNIEVDHPKLVSAFVEQSLAGHDIVMGVSRKVNSFAYRQLRALSTWLLKSIGYGLPSNSTGSFCFSRRAINALTESGRYYCKLYARIANIGYALCPLSCDDLMDTPKKKKISEGIVETMHHMVFNSTKPLRWMSFLGIFGSLMALVFSCYSVVINLLKDQVAPGWTTTILFMSFLFMILFIMLSFFGEYLARLLNDRSEHKEYSVVYEQNSSVMLNEDRQNVLFSSMTETDSAKV